MICSQFGRLLVPSLACLVLICLHRANPAEATDFRNTNDRQVLQESETQNSSTEETSSPTDPEVENGGDDSGGGFRSEDDETYCFLCPRENGCLLCCCQDGKCVDPSEAADGTAVCKRGNSVKTNSMTALVCADCLNPACKRYYPWCM